MCFLQKKFFFPANVSSITSQAFPGEPRRPVAHMTSRTAQGKQRGLGRDYQRDPQHQHSNRTTTTSSVIDSSSIQSMHRVQGRSQGGETTTYRAVSSKRFGFSWTTTQAGPVDHSCANSSSPSPSCSPTRQQQPDYLTHGGTDDIPKTLTPRHSPSQPHPRGPAQRPQPEPKRH